MKAVSVRFCAFIGANQCDGSAEQLTEGATKAILQGSNYKKTLQECLDRVKDLTSKMHLEATICSQHRIQDIEESVRQMQREMKDVQVSMRNVQRDEARIIGITTRIGDILEEGVVNGIHYHSQRQTVMIYGTSDGLNATEERRGATLIVCPGEGSPMLLESGNSSPLVPFAQSIPGQSFENSEYPPLTF